MNKFLELSDISASYGSQTVLDSVSFGIKKGAFLVILGPSGCGKSTLLNVIAGLTQPDDGLVRIDKQTVNDLHPSLRDIAMVFQSYALYPNMTVRDNILFGLKNRGVSKEKRNEAVREVSSLLQLEDVLRRKPSQLSGGQRQRVAIGRAIVRNPKLFLFDEPLSNLDVRLRVETRSEIKKLQKSLGTTTVYVTHDQLEAMTLATDIIVMKDGGIQQCGTPHEVYHSPENIFVAKFIGSPGMNILNGRVEKAEKGYNLRITNGETQIVLRAPNGPRLLANYLGRNVTIGLRPEAITDPKVGDDDDANVTTIELPVGLIEPTGADTFVEVAIDGGYIIARMDAKFAENTNQSAAFSVHVDSAVYFNPDTGSRIV